MDILYLLIPLSVVLVLVVGAVFWWALASGQFEDLEGPAHRILMDDDPGAESAPRARPGGAPGAPGRRG
ncbi:MAG: cbb3-type cytochrome oxidase assembly protein CcoS [Burkholderiales bacterium]|nr:cbb3-type cytochrome oxidase assembly protein CcoS [Burkholderiales bacterium]